MSKAKEDGWSTVVTDLFTPYSSGKGLMGVASHVTIETAVGQIVRMMMRLPRNIRDDAILHALEPTTQGYVNFGKDVPNVGVAGSEKVDFFNEATEGAKTIPNALRF